MKLTLIFLSICVAISHQQFFHPRVMVGYPWMPPFVQRPMYFNNFMGPYRSQLEDFYDTDDVQMRVKGLKGFKPQGSSLQQQIGENRFLFGSGSSSIGNPLLKTVTFTITSTCTALSITTCVAISNLSPNPVACAGRRRRFAEYDDEQGEDIEAQYPIIPSEVRIVMPTEEPSSGLSRAFRQSPIGISSSIDDEENELASNSIGKQQRGKRFFQQFWNAFATGITTTTWSVVSSTFTSTLVIPGVSTVLPCLPAGYGVCQIAVGK